MLRALPYAFVALLSSGVATSAPKTGTVTGTINVLVKGAPKADKSKVVVYLEGVPGDPPKQKTASIRQVEKQFDPPLTIVVKGTTVEFPNEDKIFHNVFSVSRPAQPTSSQNDAGCGAVANISE